MSRSLRSLLCAVSMLAVATGAANAQAAPTTSTTSSVTPATEFTLPAACQPLAVDADSDETHGEQVHACVEALRTEVGDDQGIGQWVSQFAHEGKHADDQDDDKDEDKSTSSTSTTTTTSAPQTTQSGTSSETEHGHGQGRRHHQDS